MSSLLLIGLGNMGRKYLNKFLELGLKPTLCDLKEELKEEFKEFSFYCFYDQIEEKPRKVFIMVNPKFHPSVARHFLQKGSYVFLEKPPALSFGEFKDLLDRFGKENLGVSEIERYSYAVRGFKPNLYRVERIVINRLNRGFGYINPLWDLAWHDLYLLLYLFGEFEIEEVNQKGKNFYTLLGRVKGNIPFELNVAWGHNPSLRKWLLETEQGEVLFDFLKEERHEGGNLTSRRKEGDKLKEMVLDVLKGTYDSESVDRALFILKALERVSPVERWK